MSEALTVSPTKGAQDVVKRHIEESIAAKRRLIGLGVDAIVRAADAISDAFRGGRKLLLCGNGGSAADAQHIAAEFVSLLRMGYPRPGLPAIALTTDTSLLTASANDFGFEGVFARQVEALGQAGDVVLGISTSGNSNNILRALEVAHQHGLKTIGLSGEGGGKMAALCDVLVAVPSRITQHIQECHIAIGHVICELVECEIFPREKD